MACLQRLDIKQPPGGMVTTEEGALAEAGKLGYPVRPLQPCLSRYPRSSRFYCVHAYFCSFNVHDCPAPAGGCCCVMCEMSAGHAPWHYSLMA